MYITVIYFLSFVFLPLKRLYFVTPSGHLQREQVTEEKINKVRQLNDLAKQRGQTLAEMACRFGRTRIIGNTVQILIRQHALCQWREGDHPYSFLLQQRQQVRSDPAIQHRITRLMDQARHTMFFQYGKCFFRLSGSVIRYPDIQGFSLADDVSQCSHRFFDRRLWVRTMRIENK